MSIASETIIEQVRNVLSQQNDLNWHFDPPAYEPSVGSYHPVDSLPIAAELADKLSRSYPNGFFRHQAEAISAILSGQHTVVATRTSSGKSLIYSTPVLDAMIRDEEATSLFIYPQKALANDQLTKLQELCRQIPSLSRTLVDCPSLVSRYDGATPSESRAEIRSSAKVVLTNPDMLHQGILQYHERNWSRFFANLKYVIIDECHEYRGIFGTNVAYILRRLRQVCAFHGSSPKFVATSATIREPKEHLERLTGLPFTCVGPEKDGSAQGRKKFWIVSSEDHHYELGRKIALELAASGLSVLAFCPSRVAAERMTSKVQAAKDDEASYVRVYRSGLSSKDREEIENGLRDKTVRLVFSTSALELGIDIGSLDVVVCIGLPSSMMSFWQRAGRVARGGKEGAIVLIPANTPIDSYFAENPQALFEKQNESLALHLENPRVRNAHYACASREAGGSEDRMMLDVLGSELTQVASLRMEGKLDEEIFYRTDPHSELNVRSMGEGMYELLCGHQSIGQIDDVHLMREAYRNAIYRHGGVAYRVKDIIKGRKQIKLDRNYNGHDTTPYLQKKIRLKRRKKVAEYKNLSIATVDVDVTEILLLVQEKDRSGKVVQQWQGSAGMPAHALPTTATQILLGKELWSQFENEVGTSRAKTALTSCERMLTSLFPAIAGPCDFQDFSSLSEIQKDGNAAIYLYDNVLFGVDLTAAAFENIESLIDMAVDRLMSCTCQSDEGCFRCISNPRTDEVTSKFATSKLLQTIGNLLLERPASIRVIDDGDALTVSTSSKQQCKTCGSEFNDGDRFCKNCGEKILES